MDELHIGSSLQRHADWTIAACCVVTIALINCHLRVNSRMSCLQIGERTHTTRPIFLIFEPPPPPSVPVVFAKASSPRVFP